MRIYDVSVPISAATPVYPGDPGIEITQTLALAQGDPANVTNLKFGAHTGTHVDAPAHFIDGAATVESMNLEMLIGPAHLVELPADVLVIDDVVVERFCPAGAQRLLFKTRNSAFWRQAMGRFRPDYTCVSPAGAEKLVGLGAGLVGIDYLSIEQFQPEKFLTHEILLRNDVIIIEGLDLSNVPQGKYELICLPLKIASGSGDGAPARVVLRSFA